MRIWSSDITNYFWVLCIILCTNLEIAFLNIFFVKIQLSNIYACHFVFILNKLGQPFIQQVFQMFCLSNFLLIILVFLLLLFMQLFALLFLGLLKLGFERLNLIVYLLLCGLWWDKLLLAFLWGWVRVEPVGQICYREIGSCVKYLR